MEYTFTTEYNSEAMTTGAKARRKTLRKKRHRRTVILGIIVFVLAALLVLPPQGEKFVFSLKNTVTSAAAVIIALTLLFEDKINGWAGSKRAVKGMSPAICTFAQENYTSATSVGTTVFNYNIIKAIAEDKKYFVFLVDNNHVQLYDKSTVTGGTAERFADFIKEKTGLDIVKI